MVRQNFRCGDAILGQSGMVKRITKIKNGVAEFEGGSIPIEALKNNIRTGICMWISKEDDKDVVYHMLNFMNTSFLNRFKN